MTSGWPAVPSFRSWLDAHAAGAGDRTFLEFHGRSWTYADLKRITDAIAGELHRRGLSPGDRLAIALPNSPEHLFAWLGAAKLGVAVAPLHAQWTPTEIDRALTQLRPRLVVGAPAREDASPAPPSTTEAPSSISFSPSMEAFRFSTASSLSSPLSPAAPQSPPPVIQTEWISADEVTRWIADSRLPFPGVAEMPVDAPAELLYTSGTTGLPKAAVQSFRSMILTGEAFASWLGLGPDDRLFTCLPLAHVNARFYSTMGAIAAGATLRIEERFSASRFWSWIAESRVTVVNTIGAMLRILLQSPPADTERSHRLRLVYTSPALGDELHRRFEERFGVRLVVGYGMTECTFGFIHPIDAPLSSTDRHLESMGRPRRHPNPRWTVGWRLVDPESVTPTGSGAPREVEPGEVGEIWLSGPTVFSGYFEHPEATASVLREDGWLRTGDLAVRDAAGYWTFVGRTKEMIRRRGENVSPLEIEAVLMSHPAVAEAAVIGVPAELGEEEIVAFVAPREGETLAVEALSAYCAERVARFKVPSAWRIVAALPRTSTNRVAKGELAAQFARERDSIRTRDVSPES